MFKRIKESLPDNKKTALLVIGLVCLVIGQILSSSTSTILLILRYMLFLSALALYFYVAVDQHKVITAIKKAGQEDQEE